MIIKFDSFNRHELPMVTLCNPNDKEIGIVDNVQDFEIIPTLNQVSELSCTVNRYFGDIENPSYKYIEKLRQFYVDGFGYFIIIDVTEENAGTGEAYKTVNALSCEFELSNIDMPVIQDGYYVFENLINTIMEYLPNWTLNIASIPGTIISKSRYFEDVDTNIYSFLMSSVEEAYNCLFEFDNINRTITVFDKDDFVTATSVFLTNDDVVNSIKIAQNTKEMYTAVKALGGNNLDISYVNPLGDNTIYDLHYYKNNKWMSQGLIDALTAWENKIAVNETTYASLVSSLTSKYSDKATIEVNLDNAKKSLDDLQTQKSSIIAQNGSLTSINAAIGAQQDIYNSFSSQLAIKESEITALENQKSDINNALNFNTNFTADQYKELTHYILCCKHQTDKITASEGMTQADVIQKALELYNDAKSVLSKISDPKYEYSVDTESFIFNKVFEPYTSQLATGCLVDIQLAEDDIASLILLSMPINFIDGTVSFKFGNRYKLSNQRALWDDLQSRVTSTSRTVENLKDRWNYPVKSNAVNEIKNFMNSSLDITKNAIISSDGQSIEVRDDGIHIRRKLPDGTLDPKELIITNGTIAFSDDNFTTSKLALGTITFPDNSTAYGLIAEAIYGNLIAGNQLVISNEDGSVVINGNGITIYDGGITIYDGDGQKIFSVDPNDDTGIKNVVKIYGTLRSLSYPNLSTSIGKSEAGNYGAFIVSDSTTGNEDLFSVYKVIQGENTGVVWTVPFLINEAKTNRKGLSIYPNIIKLFADYNGSPKGFTADSSTGDVSINGNNLIINSNHFSTTSAGTMTVKTDSADDTMVLHRGNSTGSFLANFMNDGVQSTISFQQKTINNILKSLLVLTAYPMSGQSAAILLTSSGYDRACFGAGSNNDEIRFDLEGSGTTYTKDIRSDGNIYSKKLMIKDQYTSLGFYDLTTENERAALWWNNDGKTLNIVVNSSITNSVIRLTATNVYANNISITSDKSKKSDIHEISDVKALDKVTDIKFYSYDLDISDDLPDDQKYDEVTNNKTLSVSPETRNSNKKHVDIGIMADEAPIEILGENGKSIDLYKYCNLLAKAIQEQNEVITELREEIKALKSVD